MTLAKDNGAAPGTAVANPTLASFRRTLGDYSATAPRVRGGAGYLNFSKGDWTFGRDKAPFDLESLWLVNPATLQHGYICWRDGKIFHETLLALGHQLPAETSLPEPPEPKPGSDDQAGYQYQLGYSAVCIEGRYAKDADMSTGHFKSSSVGGTGAIQTLIDDLNARLDECEATGSDVFYPIVQYGTDSYMHKTRGKIWVPTITIVGFSANRPGEEPEWLEGEEEAAPPPPPPAAKTRLRRVAAK